MIQVTIHEAKTHLSRLIEKVMHGEKVVIAKRDAPMVRLEKITRPAGERRVGGLKGIVKCMGAGFDQPLADMEAWMNEAEGTKKSRSRRRAV